MILRSCGFSVPWKPAHTGEGQSLVLRAEMSPGSLSAAMGRQAVPAACRHPRKRRDPEGGGTSAARRDALDIELSDSVGTSNLL